MTLGRVPHSYFNGQCSHCDRPHTLTPDAEGCRADAPWAAIAKVQAEDQARATRWFQRQYGPPPQMLPPVPVPLRTVERALMLANERGPGIAAKDLKPKTPDYSAWVSEEDLLEDER